MPPKDGLKRGRDTHLGRLLLELSKDFVASSNEKVRSRGYDFVRATHIRVLSQIADEGTELAQIILRVGLSKQAVNKVVRQLEEVGIIVTKVSERDSRARVLHFTAKGRRFLDVGLDVIDELEAEYLNVLGKTDFQHLKATLMKLADARRVRTRSYDPLDE